MIYTLANDKFINEFKSLVGSFIKFGLLEKLRVIKFNDNDNEIKYICNKLKISYIEDSHILGGIDQFARLIYDRSPPTTPYPEILNKLRKLYFLNNDDNSIFIDCDCILTNNLIINILESNISSFGYINTDLNGAYEFNSIDSKFLCSGFLFKPSNINISINDLKILFTEENINLFHKLRVKTGYVDQPFFNFLFDFVFKQYKLVDLSKELDLSPISDPLDEYIFVNSLLEPFDAFKRPIFFLHRTNKFRDRPEFNMFFEYFKKITEFQLI